MSTTADLVTILKAELKAAGLTYAQLATHLGMAESSIKRIFAMGDMTLSRIDEICRVLKLDFAELAQKVADTRPQRRELTLEQEKAVVANPRLLLMAICCMSQWSLEQVLATYSMSEAECIKYLTRLDRLGIIELKPMNRYRLQVAKTFRWRPDGPVMKFFRREVMGDYFAGGFDGEGEMLSLVHGSIGRDAALALNERLQRVAQDFATEHFAGQKMPASQRDAYTLVIGMRSWLFAPFRELRRPAAD
jgi:transcriptional regulator with XRE-family HTH domain